MTKVPVRPGGSDLCFEWPGPIGEGQEHLSHHGACTYRVCTRAGGGTTIGVSGSGYKGYSSGNGLLAAAMLGKVAGEAASEGIIKDSPA